MEYKKIVYEGYVLGIGMVEVDGNITEQECIQLQDLLRSKPIVREGYDYKLRDVNYEWEEVEKPNIDEVDDSSALTELAEVITNDEE